MADTQTISDPALATAPRAIPDYASFTALFVAVFPSVALPMFLAALDTTIVSTALPAMGGALGEVDRLSWVVVSYLVANTIGAPIYGRLGDQLGRKPMLFFALILFTVASILCALAPSIVLLTGARLLQGLGGAGLMTLSQALIGECVPLRERGRFMSYSATVFMLASMFGPVAGGALTQRFGWPAIFWINVPLGAVALLLLARLRLAPQRLSGRQGFDYAGVVLFAAFVGPLLLGFEQLQRLTLHTLPNLLGLLAVALVALAVLVRVELRAPSPLLPLRLLLQPALWRLNAMGALAGAMMVSLVTFVPLFLQVARGTSPSRVGLLLLPLTIGVVGGAMLTGNQMRRTGRTAIFPAIGLPVSAVMMVFLAFFLGDLGPVGLGIAFLITAMGLGTTMPIVQTMVQQLAGQAQLGAASASVQFSRSIGSSMGTAAVSAMLFALLAARDAGTGAMFGALMQHGPQLLASLPAARQALIQAEVAAAFRGAFLVVAGFAGLAAIMAWNLPAHARRL